VRRKGVMAHCTIRLVTLNLGDILHGIRLGDDIRELFDAA
jgi:hypothetical protein